MMFVKHYFNAWRLIVDTAVLYDPVFVRIDQLLHDQGKQQKELIDYLSMARNTYVNWKTQKNKSYMKHINEIADFFNVSPNYLIRGDEPRGNNSDYENELIRHFRKLNSQNSKIIFDLIKALGDSQK